MPARSQRTRRRRASSGRRRAAICTSTAHDHRRCGAAAASTIEPGRPAPFRISRLPGLAGIGLIRLYKLVLSPFLGPSCRYLPTCSSYGEEAIRRYGLWAGGWMTLARFQRCGPFGASGYDPVPETIPSHAHWYAPWRYGHWTGRHIDPATRLD